jgi:hypothetical protein
MINMVVNDLKKKGVHVNFDENTEVEGKQATEMSPGLKMKREAEYLKQAPEGESMERLEKLYDNVEEMIVNGQYMVMGKPRLPSPQNHTPEGQGRQHHTHSGQW